MVKEYYKKKEPKKALLNFKSISCISVIPDLVHHKRRTDKNGNDIIT
jgi:hypothetical protein